jgi:hypothetical protein
MTFSRRVIKEKMILGCLRASKPPANTPNPGYVKILPLGYSIRGLLRIYLAFFTSIDGEMDTKQPNKLDEILV